METIKFAIFSDLHYDYIPDGLERINKFIQDVQKEDLNFIIQLGDICPPKTENKFILDMLNSLKKPLYHVIGNHESDKFSRDTILSFFQMNSSYYSFKYRKIKFIVLDTCFMKCKNEYKPYFKKAYQKGKDIYPIVPDFEINWLKNELNDLSDYYVIFSHHSLENDFYNRGAYNRHAIQDVINKANCNHKKVLLAINGHNHGNSLKRIGETFYFTLNSMSCIWTGLEYAHFSYSKEVHQKYPFLKDLIVYKEPLYSIITIDDNGNIQISGINGHYQNVSPKDIGLGEMCNGLHLSPNISSFTLNNDF